MKIVEKHIFEKTIKIVKKPIKFEELLRMQKILNEEIKKPSIPGKVSWLDITLALDDKFQEWLKQLPKEYNFETWEEKIYSKEKELEALTDILFLFLKFANTLNDVEKVGFELNFNEDYSNIDEFIKKEYKVLTRREALSEIEKIYFNNIFNIIIAFKQELWDFILPIRAFKIYWIIVYKRGFTKEEIIDKYCKKWEEIIEKMKED